MSSGCKRPAVRSSRSPAHQFGHQSWCIEGRRCLENHAGLHAALVELRNIIGRGFVTAAVPRILFAVSKQIPMQLLDGAFGKRDVLPGRIYPLHQLGVSGGLLLVLGSESLISRLDKSCSASRSVNLLPSIRIDEPILSIVAALRRAISRSGASVSMARHAPLNSLIRAISARISGVIWIVSDRIIYQININRFIVHPFTPI